MIRASRLLVVALMAATAAGCSTVSRLNPFDKGDANASLEGSDAPEQRERIPLIALDQQLNVSDALKGIGFYIPPAQTVAEAPLPGGDPELAEHSNAAAQFKVAWKRKIGKGSSRNGFITAPPVVAGGRVYTLDAQAGVAAFDAVTGAPVWRVDLNPKIKRDKTGFGGGVAYADGKLFVTSGYRFVAALDAATGAVLWKVTVDSAIHSAPTVALGRVMAINVNNRLQTFDVATGRAGWDYQGLIEPARILQATTPAVSGESVVAAFSSGELIAFRGSNGSELWTGNLTRASRNTALSELRDIAGRPVIYKGDVFAASHSGVFAAITLRTGEARWQLPVISIATPWPVGDVIYIVSNAGEVICASRSNGQVYWIRDLNQGRRQTSVSRVLGREKVIRSHWTGVVLASGRLISVSNDGRAVALDPQTGEVKSYLNLGGPAVITPVAVGAYLYVITEEGDLVAIQ